MKHSHWIVAPFLLLTTACLDLKPAPAPPVHWLDLNPPAVEMAPTGEAASAAKRDSVSLGRVSASEAITERLMRRTEAHEVRYDDYSRWTEDPAAVTRRALEEALYRQRSLRRASTLRLEVELVRLEIESDGRPAAVVTLIALAEDSGGVLVDRRFEGRAEVTVEGPAGEAAAASAALAAAVSDVADEVVGN
jgi:ABC-type uncharacterized transport system auxiliary subunit